MALRVATVTASGWLFPFIELCLSAIQVTPVPRKGPLSGYQQLWLPDTPQTAHPDTPCIASRVFLPVAIRVQLLPTGSFPADSRLWVESCLPVRRIETGGVVTARPCVVSGRGLRRLVSNRMGGIRINPSLAAR